MLTISGLTYRVGGRHGRALLNEANAQIPDGSKIGLVGRNGAGKSTLLDLIRGAAAARYRRRLLAARLAHRISGAGGAERRRRRRSTRCSPPTRSAPRCCANCERGAGAAAHRRDRGTARRDRRPFGTGPRRAHPRRARPRRRDAGAPAFRAVGRLAHARRARRGAVFRARPAAARRADQPSRPRSGAVARTVSAPLSAHLRAGQPRPPAAQCRDDRDPASRKRQADALFGRLREISARPPRSRRAAGRAGPPPAAGARAAAGLYRPLPRQGQQGAPGAEPDEGAGQARTGGADRGRAAAGCCACRNRRS